MGSNPYGACMLRLRRCDRILWRGEGMEQLWYVRGESRLSDHRPVNSLFSVQLVAAARTEPPETDLRAASMFFPFLQC